jgi:hypothetical protein
VAILPIVRASWPGSLQSALAATLTTPEGWAMALAAFLVRGGILLVILPIVALPTPAGFITAVSPTIEQLLLGTPSLAGSILAAAALTSVVVVLGWAGLAGAWIDDALVREAAASDELDLAWEPTTTISSWRAFGLRLAAHIPTLLALGYAIVRVVLVGYAQFTAPDDPGVPVVDRVIARVPDALGVVVIAWLFGEVVGALAARRAAAGLSNGGALLGSVRQLFRPRGIATFVATSALLVVTTVPFALAAERAWEHVRSYLLFGADAVQLTAAIVVLVATWVLGLTIVGAALAWRATAWTAEVTTA